MTKRLYGREKTVADLLTAFEKVSESNNEVVMVTGYSGIGKTSLVKEIYKPLTYRKGYFIHGKYDQLQQNTPYSAIVSAFDYLIKQILAEPETRLQHFRTLMSESLGELSLLLSSLLPSLKYLINIGPTEDSNVKDAKSQVTFAFQQLVRVFRQGEQPIVIFLDDLQWADKPSLELLESLMIDEDGRFLMLIGAYRDNEVEITHPITTFLQQLREKKRSVNIIKLTPLSVSDMEFLLADTLSTVITSVKSLADIICKKTEGNPFYANEFLKNLYRENLLKYNYEASVWEWEIEAIRKKTITLNVADLLINNIRLLTNEAQHLLKIASCIGYRFDLETLAASCELPYPRFINAIDEIMQAKIIFIENGDFKSAQYQSGYGIIENVTFQFTHDKIQQAAEQLIQEAEKIRIHFELGRLLIKNSTLLKVPAELMRVADHFTYAKSLIIDEKEKFSVANILILAGKNAQLSAAYDSAVVYYRSAKELLPQSTDPFYYSLTYNLNCDFAESLSFSGKFDEADKILDQLFLISKNKWDKARAYEIKAKRLRLVNRYDEALRQTLTCLNMLGHNLPLHPKVHQILYAYLAIKWQMFGKKYSELDLTKKAETNTRLILKILTSIYADCAITNNKELLALASFYSIKLSINNGFAEESAYAFISSGFIILQILKRYNESIEYFLIKEKLENLYPDTVYRAVTLFVYGFYALHWHRPLRQSIDHFIQSHQYSYKIGDIETLIYAQIGIICNLFALGEPLNIVRQHNKIALDRFEKQGSFKSYYTLLDRTIFNFTNGEELLIDNLQASKLESAIVGKDNNEIAFFYALYVKISYLYGDYRLTIQLYEKWLPYSQTLLGLIPYIENCFYYVLALAKVAHNESKANKISYLKKIKKTNKQFELWATWSSINFKEYYLLVLAEIAALEDNFALATEYYDEAAKLASEKNIYHLSAIINECAANYFIYKKKVPIASYYLRKAKYYYDQWRAVSLSNKLMKEYSFVLAENDTELNVANQTNNSFSNITSQNDVMFDFMSILKLTKIISAEMQVDKLLQKILHILLENAGAERAMLYNKKGDEWFVEAEGNIHEQVIWLSELQPIAKRNDFPKKLLSYVLRTGESIIINDTETETQFNDEYMANTKISSLLFIPLFYQGQLNRILYLENKMKSYYFTSQHTQSLGIVGSQAVVSLENAYLYYQATHDVLTGLANRNLLYQLFQQSAARVDREQKQIAIIFLDLDNFKTINDTFGHDAGDKVLIYISQLIKSCLNKGDLAVRLGGDEFVLLLDGILSFKEVESLMSRYFLNMQKPLMINGTEIQLSCSAGISIYPKDGNTIPDLLYNADIALYQAKELGKNQYQFFSKELTEKIKQDFEFENDLRKAFHEKQLCLYYQPIYNLKSKEIEGLEVLLRWQHPTRGLLDAKEFIHLLKKYSLILEIGYWILKSACQQLKDWQNMGLEKINISVNVSSLQLKNNTFSQSLQKILAETKLDPSFLELELTESVFIEQNNRNKFELEAIKNLGVSLVIDDFGTGYSSLTYLIWLPISKLKIDQSFIKNCHYNENSMTIVEMIINLAHRLKLSVVAEGIETAEQLQSLADRNADSLQGYYMSKPLSSEECKNILFKEE